MITPASVSTLEAPHPFPPGPMPTDSVKILKHLANTDHAERPVDEFANFVTHGLGFLLSLPASIVLLVVVSQTASSDVFWACAVYAASLTGLYGASTLSHSFYLPSRRRFYQMVDQAFIYFLIAGTFTPFGVLYPGTGWWKLLLPTMWVLAFAGAILVFWTRHVQGLLKVIPYVLFGWFPALAIPNIVAHAPETVLNWLLAGGILYTVGTYFLIQGHRVRYFHALWHTLVIGASACHFIAILQAAT